MLGIGGLFDQNNSKAIVPLDAHCLNDRRLELPEAIDPFGHLTDALNVRVWAGFVDHITSPDDVVHDNGGPLMREFERPLEVIRVARLVCVDADEVERCLLSLNKRSSASECRAYVNLH